MDNAQPGRGLRADARSNRAQLVEAARALLAEKGPAVPTDEIARRAGVGVATLYRHFPDRESLVHTVAIDGFERVVRMAREAEDEEPDAWHGLVRFVRRAAAELRLATWLSIWFAGTWEDVRADPEDQRLRGVLLKIIDRLVRRAQADGALRDDVNAADVLLMLALLLRPIAGTRLEVSPRSLDRYLTIALDGLRDRPDRLELPEAELGPDDLAVAIPPQPNR